MFQVTLQDPKTGTEVVVGDPGEAARLRQSGYRDVKPADVKPERVLSAEQTNAVAQAAKFEKPKTDTK